MSRSRFFFRNGAVTWIAGGIAHFVMMDVLILHGRTRLSGLAPHFEFLDIMQKTVLSFGVLGSSTAFLGMAGFSMGLGLSSIFLGLTFLLLGAQKDIVLRPFTRLGAVISATFCAISAACFIFSVTLGGLLALALFVACWVRKES